MATTRVNDPLAAKLFQLRTSLALTRAVFGESLGVPATRIQDIERGKQRLTSTLLKAIEQTYGPMALSNVDEPAAPVRFNVVRQQGRKTPPPTCATRREAAAAKLGLCPHCWRPLDEKP